MNWTDLLLQSARGKTRLGEHSTLGAPSFDSQDPGTLANPPAGSVPAIEPAASPGAALQQAIAAYQGVHGAGADPLLGDRGGVAGAAIQNARGTGQVVTVGQTQFHIFVDPKTGKRTVLRVHGPAIGGGGPTISAGGSRAQPTR